MMGEVVALNSIAESLAKIARELGRLNNSASLITSLETEIVLDLRNRREAERASYAAYNQTLTDDKNVLPAEQVA